MVGTHLVDKCKCVNLEDLAYLFTSIEEIGPKCIDKITELDAQAKDIEISRLRRAWTGVRAALAASSQSRSNDDDNDLDKLLTDDDLAQQKQLFWARYKVSFSALTDAGDVLVSRLTKEIRRRSLSCFDVMKARSVASQATAKRKESRISNSASIVTDETEEPMLEESFDLYVALLKTYLIALARAGVHPRPNAPIAKEELGTASVNYVEIPLDVVFGYLERAEVRARKLPAQRRLGWIRSRDIEDRMEWCSTFRNSTESLGSIIQRLFIQREALWVTDQAPPQPPVMSAPPAGKQPATYRSQQSDRQPATQSKSAPQPPPKRARVLKTLSAMKDGRTICSDYNRGKCTDPCPRKHLHVCNAEVKPGRACAMRNHTAAECRNY